MLIRPESTAADPAEGATDQCQRILIVDLCPPMTASLIDALRDIGVESLILPSDIDPESIDGWARTGNIGAVIISGGQKSVKSADAESHEPPAEILTLCDQEDCCLPILTIGSATCWIANSFGGTVKPVSGNDDIRDERIGIVLGKTDLFSGQSGNQLVKSNRGDIVTCGPQDFRITAKFSTGAIAAMEHLGDKIYCLRFYPQETDAAIGKILLANFCHVAGIRARGATRTHRGDLDRRTIPVGPGFPGRRSRRDRARAKKRS